MTFTGNELETLAKVLTSDLIKNAIGKEEWDLSINDEIVLWYLIKSFENYRTVNSVG